MSSSKHTPGPWDYVAYANRDSDAPVEYRVRAKGLRWVALTASGDSEDEANARLIAAAPELLEALEACREGIDILLARIIDYGFDLKGAATDSLKKCASLIGVGLYLSEKSGGQTAPAPAAARAQTLLEYTRQHGIPDATVIDLAQERYGKPPANLTRDEKRALIAALNEQKKGAAA